jgi:RecB family exonuclease
MGEVLRRRAVALAPPLVDNEQRRATALLAALLEQERQRPAFSIAQLELAEQRTLGGALIRVRMDRVDRLADGRLVVLDYKSGRDQSFDGLDERPLQPQLQAYALLAGGEPGAGQLAGVAALYLAPQGIRWRGASADPAQLPGLSTRTAPLPPWPDLLAHWRRVIDALVQGFLAGDARVAPRPKACDQCHLASLCRIDDATRPGIDAEDDEAGGAVPGSHGH